MATALRGVSAGAGEPDTSAKEGGARPERLAPSPARPPGAGGPRRVRSREATPSRGVPGLGPPPPGARDDSQMQQLKPDSARAAGTRDALPPGRGGGDARPGSARGGGGRCPSPRPPAVRPNCATRRGGVTRRPPPSCAAAISWSAAPATHRFRQIKT
ncbi:uncharacterized protein [Macaca fascicularis]|uniref:basic salivary proline-rich protein 3 n=1 Tax=Macaca mulatta TaxID=9544 RepID=UPI0010A210AD|nr:basic salivary proline-rich protein 3 [Macaca mulatta]